MTVSRRRFFGLFGAGAALAVVPVAASVAPTATEWRLGKEDAPLDGMTREEFYEYSRRYLDASARSRMTPAYLEMQEIAANPKAYCGRPLRRT